RPRTFVARALHTSALHTLSLHDALPILVPPDGYWPAIAEVCRRHGVLLIADEVMTGFGRTGRWFGVDHWGIRPDILVGAKGGARSEEHTSELQSLAYLVCRLLLEKINLM